jgi:hypothetical protein
MSDPIVTSHEGDPQIIPESQPLPITPVDPGGGRANTAQMAQMTSAALGITGLAMTAAGASQSTAEAFLGLGHNPAVQAAMFFGFGTVPASLTWGIVVTAVSVGLNLYSLWLRYRSRESAAAAALGMAGKSTLPAR